MQTIAQQRITEMQEYQSKVYDRTIFKQYCCIRQRKALKVPMQSFESANAILLHCRDSSIVVSEVVFLLLCKSEAKYADLDVSCLQQLLGTGYGGGACRYDIIYNEYMFALYR